jgi:hypothetical protein
METLPHSIVSLRTIRRPQRLKDLVDVHYPDAGKIVLVLDNLSIHTPASL